MIRNGAAHWPTNSAQSSCLKILSIRDALIEPRASPKKTLDGTLPVCFSIAPVKRSSVASPANTLLSIMKLLCDDVGVRLVLAAAIERSREIEGITPRPSWGGGLRRLAGRLSIPRA